MDFQLKQWRNQQQQQQQQQQHESEDQQQHSAKIPKLLHLEDPHQNSEPSSGFALPLFVPDPNTKMSAFSESTQLATSATRFPKMGTYFSLSQWQELELQALIFRYMLAGAAVPPELLHPIKKSLLHSTPYFLHHPLQQYPHFQPALLQSGYWGRGAMDPEPTRCRRTDGKKWRCSRDVVAGQKYCERHVHRGRNRSRKPVEVTTTTSPTTTAGGGGSSNNNSSLNASTTTITTNSSSHGTHFAITGSSPPSIDLLHLNRSSSESKTDSRGLFEPRGEVSGSVKSDSHVLRPFFDDWPGKLQELDRARSNASSMNSATSLSLKLSTGNGVEPGHQDSHAGRGQPQLNWPVGWATNQMSSMGGPLGEALRSSSNSNSSPTSVLHQLARSSASESFIST